MGRHGETSFHMGDEEHAFPRPRRRLDFPLLRQPPATLRHQSVDDKPADVFSSGGRREPVSLDPFPWRSGTRARRLLRSLQLRRLVLRHRRGALRRRSGFCAEWVAGEGIGRTGRLGEKGICSLSLSNTAASYTAVRSAPQSSPAIHGPADLLKSRWRRCSGTWRKAGRKSRRHAPLSPLAALQPFARART